MKGNSSGSGTGSEKNDGFKYRKLKSEKLELPTEDIDVSGETLNGSGGLNRANGNPTSTENTVPKYFTRPAAAGTSENINMDTVPAKINRVE